MISIRDGEEGSKNPFRTGGWVVVKDEAIYGLGLPDELLKSIMDARFCFVPDAAWDLLLGLPRNERMMLQIFEKI